MKPDEKQKLREQLAFAVYRAHEAYIAAKNACDAMDIDCRNVQCIYWIDGRDRAHKLMVNGKIITRE